MSTPAAAELQRWTEEVARDPASPAFLPLARALRRQGRRDAAARVCLRGLEHNPAHLDAHGLLALLYLEGGDRARACDEWAAILTHDAGHFEANRGLGFHYLEQGELARARSHLELAAERRAGDPAVGEALAYLAKRERQAAAGGVVGGRSPGARAAQAAAAARPPRVAPSHSLAVEAGEAGGSGDVAAETAPRDPTRAFEPLLAEAPFIGALILDRLGLVLAGTSRAGSAVDEMGAILGAAIDEAARTAEYLKLGGWKGVLLEAEGATLHLAPLPGELAVLLAVRDEAPTGYVLRMAARAGELARAFLGGQP